MFKQSKNKVKTIVKSSDEHDATRLNGFQRLKESSFILAILTALFLALSMYTFSPADPSWSRTSWGGEIENAGGLIGAWLADTLFFIFGSLAYIIPILLLLNAWFFLRKREEDEGIDLMVWGTRTLGITILILTSCGLAHINFDDIWSFSSGGVVGDVLTNLAVPIFNLLGTTVVLLFLWGAGFTLFTGISWLTIVEWVGESVLTLIALALNQVRGSKEQVYQPNLGQSETNDKTSLERSPSNATRVEPQLASFDASLDQFDQEKNAVVDENQELDSDLEFQPNQRQYHIHMPTSENAQNSQQVETDATAFSSPVVSMTPFDDDNDPLFASSPAQLNAVPDEEQDVERDDDVELHDTALDFVPEKGADNFAPDYSPNATIAELESEAKENNDFAALDEPLSFEELVAQKEAQVFGDVDVHAQTTSSVTDANVTDASVI